MIGYVLWHRGASGRKWFLGPDGEHYVDISAAWWFKTYEKAATHNRAQGSKYNIEAVTTPGPQ